MATFKAQILIIGDELLSGRIQDANTAPMAKWLIDQGFNLQGVRIVKDHKDDLLKNLDDLWKESDLVLTTGGLGPTEDDITKDTFGEYFGLTMKENEKAREMVKAHYKRIDKEWSPKTNSYHLIPEGMDIFGNPRGLAPGLAMAKEGKLLLAAPGVPRELHAMMKEEMPKLLDQYFPERSNNSQVVTIRTHRIPEEKIFFETMPDLWDELQKDGKVSSLPQIMGVDILLSFQGSHEEKEKLKMKWKERLSESPLAPYIWTYENKSIEEVVLEAAREKSLTLSLAESCTGGLVSHRLTNIPGSSDVFLGSYVTYANELKIMGLGVQKETLEKYGAVSKATAEEMAEGMRKATGADISISLSGIAGPGGGSKEKPVGTVCIGQSVKKHSIKRSKRYQLHGDRTHLKNRFSEVALHGLLELIREY